MISLEEYFNLVSKERGEELSAEDEEILGTAFSLAEQFHAGQKRSNGDPYFEGHCVPVSLHVASLHMGSEMIAAALLHDTLEDTALTYQELQAKCGETIAELVDGVSKLSKVKFKGNERHVESLRKFFVAVAKDVRVVVLKLCDRWHNLETLQYLSPEKQTRIARESILIHAQLASRLNMGKLANILKDLAFPYAYPDEYQKTIGITAPARKKADKEIVKIHKKLDEIAVATLGYQADIDERIKGIYSSFQKLERKNWNINEIYDLVALRVIVKNVDDCYRILGAIHSQFRSMPGRMKDYISIPKPNGYKSLHTVIIDESGLNAEIQIRTIQMHTENEYGAAAHFLYKTSTNDTYTKHSFDWISQINELSKDLVSPEEYIHELQIDFFNTRIFAITPSGDVIDLPVGATILDFAYSIHSEIGDHAHMAIVNGLPRQLSSLVESESVIEIITSKNSKPRPDWLKIVVTANARNRIRKALESQTVD